MWRDYLVGGTEFRDEAMQHLPRLPTDVQKALVGRVLICCPLGKLGQTIPSSQLWLADGEVKAVVVLNDSFFDSCCFTRDGMKSCSPLGEPHRRQFCEALFHELAHVFLKHGWPGTKADEAEATELAGQWMRKAYPGERSFSQTDPPGGPFSGL
jgi:hypothetical protein